MPSRPVARGLAVLALASAVSWLGCGGGGGSDLTGPEPGSLDVTIATTGPELDPDGYTLSLDGAAAEAIAVNASRHTEGLAPGQHTVALAGLAANCTTSGTAAVALEIIAGAAAALRYDVVCAATTGAIEVTTTSAGSPADPDGYQFQLDGGAEQLIGTGATVSLPGLAPGSHAIGLGGLAGNCTVAGDNPRDATVTAGGTAQVAFAVTCASSTGGLTVTTTTTGAPTDPDGYSVTIDAGTPSAVGTSASITLGALAPGSHSVRLSGLAANCHAEGANPRAVTIAAGATAATAFAVTCSATTGALTVTVTGLPAGTDAAVTVTGPGGFNRSTTATTTVADLAPGSYAVAAADVSNAGVQYTPSPRTRNVTVAAGATAEAAVTYSAVAPPSVNFRIDGWFLTQSVQAADGSVPLVQNRDGFIRVFVVADGPNTAAPSVRLRVFRNGSLTRTLDIPAPGRSVPQARNENVLASSWNVKLPRELFTPDMQVLADVDPTNAIAEQNETDNSYPVSGTPETETTRSIPGLSVLFVPVRQQTSGLTGDVSLANKSRFLDIPRRMLPISPAQDDVHEVYTTTTTDPLVGNDANGAWGTIVGEIDALRVAEGTTQHYYGVVHLDYSAGIAGVGYIGLPTAMGYDRVDDRSRVTAHEMGHNFGRQHSPCGGPAGIDPNYPEPDGRTGAFGFDLQDNLLKFPFQPDIMGYCGNPWISPYTYEGVLAFRTAGGSAAAIRADAAPQRCLLVWGRIVDGQAVLEPAFEIVTRPSLPKARGRYSLEAANADGSRLFSLSFDPVQVEDGRRDTRQFAFAVPLGGIAGDQISSLRLGGPGANIAAARTAAAVTGARAAGPLVEARQVGGGVALRWDAAAHPMVMVRDPETGQVVSFARGGQAHVATTKRTLELVVSDRVGSQAVRVTAGQ
ncbi:MAG: hypothetical protein ABJC36_09655 [Gemmatimonadales bacterium]